MKKQLSNKERIKRLTEIIKTFDNSVSFEVISFYTNQLESLKNDKF